MDWDMNLMRSKLKNDKLYTPFSKIIPVDARSDDSDDIINRALNLFISKFMSLSIYASIRDKGLFINLAQVAASCNGKVVAVFGMGHGNAIIDNLNQLGIPNTVVVPFTAPGNVRLREVTKDTFMPIDAPGHNCTLLFTKFRAQPLKINEQPDQTTKETLERFAKISLTHNS